MTSNQNFISLNANKKTLGLWERKISWIKNVSVLGKRYLVNLIFCNPPLDTVYSWSIKNCETVSHF